jgi:hypothetical protein
MSITKISAYVFNDRERRLIKNVSGYARNDPAGFPAHNLLLIIDKYTRLLEAVLPLSTEQEIWDALKGTDLVYPNEEFF